MTRTSALAVLEIGEHREEYWNSDCFMEQVGKAIPAITTTFGAFFKDEQRTWRKTAEDARQSGMDNHKL